MRELERLSVPEIVGDLAEGLVGSAEFADATRYFQGYPAASLLEAEARAYIYLLIRAKRLERALEIGTYGAGTTEVIARALLANGRGRLDTVDPSGPQVNAALAGWHPQLAELCAYHCMNSMQFFGRAVLDGRKYDFVLVDGDHDYEPALFDIQCSAKLMAPGGFMLIDNADQPSVRAAALRFLDQEPGWLLPGRRDEMLRQPAIMASPGVLMSVEQTNLWCLRAPAAVALTNRLVTFPNEPFHGQTIGGFTIKPTQCDVRGTLFYRVYLRALPILAGPGLHPRQFQAAGNAKVSELEIVNGRVLLRFVNPMTQLNELAHRSEYFSLVEICLTYVPDPASPDRLDIAGRPTLIF